MIRLDLKREPQWLDLGHGVHVRPCTTAMMMAARAEVARCVTPSSSEAHGAGEHTAALVKALGLLGIEDWQGVGDLDDEPVPLTAEGVEARAITKPVAGSTKIYVNGTSQVSGVTVNTSTRLVTLTSAPANGAVITADFEFDVPARFDTDQRYHHRDLRSRPLGPDPDRRDPHLTAPRR